MFTKRRRLRKQFKIPKSLKNAKGQGRLLFVLNCVMCVINFNSSYNRLPLEAGYIKIILFASVITIKQINSAIKEVSMRVLFFKCVYVLNNKILDRNLTSSTSFDFISVSSLVFCFLTSFGIIPVLH